MAKRERKPYKVFCVGLNKTGTTTIGAVFKSLKIRTVGFEPALTRQVLRGRFELLENKLEHHDGFQDLPFPFIYNQMHERYGDSACFVLSVRKSPEVWLRSMKRHSLRNGGMKLRTRIYGSPYPHIDPETYLRIYNRHNTRFLSFAEHANLRYTKIVMGEDDLYEKICPLLGEPVPEVKAGKVNAIPTPDNLEGTRFIKYLPDLNARLKEMGRPEMSIEEAFDL